MNSIPLIYIYLVLHPIQKKYSYYYYRSLLALVSVLFLSSNVCAQAIQFQNISSSQSLSNNNVRGLAIDRSGLLWIGTNEGLNVYDGYKVSVFKNRLKPELSSTIVSAVLCDSYDRIWLGTSMGLGYLDSNRNFHEVFIDSPGSYVQSIVETSLHNIVIMTGNGLYSVDPELLAGNSKACRPLQWANDVLHLNPARIRDASHLQNDEYLFIIGDTLSIIDFASSRRTFEIKISNACSGTGIKRDEILVATYQGNFFTLNIINSKIVPMDKIIGKNRNELSITNVSQIRTISPGVVAIATFFSGLNLLDIDKQIFTQYLHDPLNEHSISEDRISNIFCLNDGNVFMSTFNTGLDYFNLKQYNATHINAFADASGHIFDGFINDILLDNKNKIWMAAFDRVIIWDRKTKSAKFLHYYKNMYNTGIKPLEIKSLCRDIYGKMWLSVYEEGVVLVNEKTGKFKLITSLDTSSKMSALKSAYVQDLKCDKEGNIWACSGFGIFCINAKTLVVDTLLHHPLLKEFVGKRVTKIWIDASDRIWFATSSFGVYCFDRTKQTLKNYSVKDGFHSNTCLCLTEDKEGNIYISTLEGLAVLGKNGRVRIYNEENGLKTSLCLGLLTDKNGNIWISGTHNIIQRFDPTDSSFKFFSDESGLGSYGFKPNSFFKDNDDEMFWGCNKGLSFFYPDQLIAVDKPFKLSIQKLLLADSVMNFTTSRSLTLPYKQNNIEFHFSAIDLYGSRNIFYQYLLDGYDTHWTTGADITEAKYNFLPPGSYIFRVRASKDGISWVDSMNAIDITILTPFWKTWWYFTLICLFVSGLLFVVIKWREKNIKAVGIEKTKVQQLTAEQYKNQLELEQISNFFSTSFINKNDIAEVLKEVVKNLINKLGFEDCMIYLWNEDKTKLVQKAGYGPLGYLEEVEKPVFEVVPGQGVVGDVALRCEAVIIPDTTADARYRPDEMVRLSEICVPVRYNDELIGIIDSEHRDKNFFTQRHLQIMATIATMIAGKIKSLESEHALQQRKNELEIVQRQLAQVQLAGLRSQMNPHFIFNSLNSINTFILKNDQENASEYLNKFSKLMRMILDNSRSEWILLESELNALKLYIELEALRFENVFSSDIAVNPDVVTSSILVPPLLIQPYVENAIWHGLMHRKEPGGKINIKVHKNERTLIIEIEDNGIGREASARLKSRTNTLHRSHGMKITAERIAIVSDVYKVSANIQVMNLDNADLKYTGTKVILTLEYKLYESNNS